MHVLRPGYDSVMAAGPVRFGAEIVGVRSRIAGEKSRSTTGRGRGRAREESRGG
jgi:acyl dehydratase